MKVKLTFDMDWMDTIQTLSDAEQGRLFTAFIQYCTDNELPDLRGNERYVWPTIKAGIDKGRLRSEIYRENVSKRWISNTTVKQTDTIVLQTHTNLPSSPPASSPAAPLSPPSPPAPPYPPIIPPPSPTSPPVSSLLHNASERFSRLWDLYPRKQGRKVAFESYKRAIRDGATDEEIEAGIKAYTAYTKGKDSCFTKQGSTFFSQRAWEDDWKTGDAPVTCSAERFDGKQEVENMRRLIDSLKNQEEDEDNAYPF